MSEPNDKNGEEEEPEIVEEEEIKNIKFSVDRSKAEKELQKELEEERKRKEELNKNLEEIKNQLEEKEENEEKQTEEYKKLKEEVEDYRGQLVDIANNRFERKKQDYVNKMKDAGFEEERLEEISEKIKTPRDLDEAEWYGDFLSSNLQKAKEEREQEEQEQEEQEKIDELTRQEQKKGGGVVELEQEEEGNYKYTGPNAYREAIDDLYRKSREGDKDAEKKLDGLWEMLGQKIKREKIDFNISECPRCGAGIVKGEVCPYCGFDPANYIKPREY